MISRASPANSLVAAATDDPDAVHGKNICEHHGRPQGSRGQAHSHSSLTIPGHIGVNGALVPSGLNFA